LFATVLASCLNFNKSFDCDRSCSKTGRSACIFLGSASKTILVLFDVVGCVSDLGMFCDVLRSIETSVAGSFSGFLRLLLLLLVLLFGLLAGIGGFLAIGATVSTAVLEYELELFLAF